MVVALHDKDTPHPLPLLAPLLVAAALLPWRPWHRSDWPGPAALALLLMATALALLALAPISWPGC